ncbi:ubiquitin binding protein [Jaminaea rosea]|uniref:Vacuolar protein sorting-associated protein 27 n=1 Tax=Jaminaea rosea TaxID=1569628 RepID=A0A316US15_9BASI|nr:ubiquitin binding protein [Jaminaea rosea]PWN27774.1 ubiquitin binding protein [Jaminaea rosea]
MSSWWGSDPFVDLVAKATSELLPAGQEDIALNLEICDKVRAKQVPPKAAMQAIKKRISDANPNVVLLALGLTDICIKNGGDHFLEEVASREFMDNLTSILKRPAGVNHDVKAKALRLIQDWAQVAEAKPAQMGYITQVYRSLKLEGFDFPATSGQASAAFVETLTAPEWVDGDVCMRCRTAFTTFNRKHHCRNCGNVFCQQCSSHNMSLPWYGVGQDVRVCDGCFNKRAPPKIPAGGNKLQRSSTTTVVPTGRGGAAAQRSNTTGAKASSSRRNKREDDDLALAIKLSLQDAPSGSRAGAASYSEPSQPRATRQPNGRMLEGTDADDDPDLAAAIAASLRDYAPPQPSAPVGLDEPSTPSMAPTQPEPSSSSSHSNLPLPPSLDLPPQDVDSLLTFSQSVAAQDAQARHYGTAPAPDHATQALYDRATAARPKMARSLDEAGRRQGVLMSMHDKLSEAVRLYDRLLDAQMARPAGVQYGYAPPPGQRAQTGSPDPFPRQHYAQHPQYYGQQQQQYPAQSAYGYGYAAQGPSGYHEQAAHQQQQQQQQYQPQTPGAMPNGVGTSSLYPSFPPAASTQPQQQLHQPPYPQEPQLTGASSQQGPYGADAPPLSPSASLHGSEAYAAYHPPHGQQQQQQQHNYYATHEYQQQQASHAPAQPFSPAQTNGAPTGPVAGLNQFEQLMSPSASSSGAAAAPGMGSPQQARTPAATMPQRRPSGQAGVGAHGGTTSAADGLAMGGASKLFPSVPTNDFAASSSPWTPNQPGQQEYQQQQQRQNQVVQEAPALIEL